MGMKSFCRVILLITSMWSAIFLSPRGVAAPQGQISVNPIGVNVNSQSPTSAFLTYGGVLNYSSVEACWCGDLIPAAPDIGRKCDPATIYGCLPARYNLARGSGQTNYTDIM